MTKLNKLIKQKHKQTMKTTGSSTSSNVPKSRNILFGTGITKRKAERSANAQDKLQNQSFDKHALEQTGAITGELLDNTSYDKQINYGKDQLRGIQLVKQEKYSVVFGQAGVGKTTVVKGAVLPLIPKLPKIPRIEYMTKSEIDNVKHAMISETGNQNYLTELVPAVAFVSYMGKAVQQLKRALPPELHFMCRTIHDLLKFAPVEELKTMEDGTVRTIKPFKPQHTEFNKLKIQLLVIDESGSVPVPLLRQLVAALPDTCRIIFLGDLFQLPPAMGFGILAYMINDLPHVQLKQIYRQQGEAASIIINADRVIHGKRPLANNTNFFMQKLPASGFEAYTQTLKIIKTLTANDQFDPINDAFIVPQNIDVLGNIAFNQKLRTMFNPVRKLDNIPVNPLVIITAGWKQLTFAVGDKIMATGNDKLLGITNGMIGVVEEIIPNPRYISSDQQKGKELVHESLSSIETINFNLSEIESKANELRMEGDNKTENNEEPRKQQASHTLKVKYQNLDELVTYSTAGSFENISHSYAITCHKAQGSEFNTVIILCHSASMALMSREWLYTAITRAQKRVIILYNDMGLNKAVNRQLIKGKTIEEKIKYIMDKSKNIPEENLPPKFTPTKWVEPDELGGEGWYEVDLENVDEQTTNNQKD